jgi:hypothetical protein
MGPITAEGDGPHERTHELTDDVVPMPIVDVDAVPVDAAASASV